MRQGLRTNSFFFLPNDTYIVQISPISTEVEESREWYVTNDTYTVQISPISTVVEELHEWYMYANNLS